LDEDLEVEAKRRLLLLLPLLLLPEEKAMFLASLAFEESLHSLQSLMLLFTHLTVVSPKVLVLLPPPPELLLLLLLVVVLVSLLRSLEEDLEELFGELATRR
jgi:hypothetical protein